jgi:hypothetical protein
MINEVLLFKGSWGDYNIHNWRTHPDVSKWLRQISIDRDECIICKAPAVRYDCDGLFKLCKGCSATVPMAINEIAAGQSGSAAMWNNSNWFNQTAAKRNIGLSGARVEDYIVIPSSAQVITQPQTPQCNMCKHWVFLGPYCGKRYSQPTTACFRPTGGNQ